MRLSIFVVVFLLPSILMAESPPVAPVRMVRETHHGITVADPYRYMEDFKSAEVQAWVKGQADYAEGQLKKIAGRDQLLARIQELDAGSPFSIFGISPQPSGDLFYYKQMAGEKVAKVYRRDAKGGQERLLLDPEKFPKANPKDHISIAFFRVSPDASKLLYGTAAAGSEQTTLRVFDIAAGKGLPDAIDRLESDYAPPYWLPDGQHLCYSRRRKLPPGAPEADGYKFTQAYLHRLGNDVADDKLVFANEAAGSPKLGEMDFPAVIIPIGSKWAIGQVKHGDETDMSIYVASQASLLEGKPKWTKVCGREDQATSYAVRGDDIYLLTAKGAPRFQVLRLSLAQPDFVKGEAVVAAGEYVVHSISVAQDALYIGMLEGVVSKIVRAPYDAGGKLQLLDSPPDEPSASVASARPDLAGCWISTRSWSRAGKLYRYDPKTSQLTDTSLHPVGKFDTPDFLTSTEVLVPSHDGVKVPLSIIHRKDIKLDGSNPTLIGGYGAYGFTAGMGFDPIQLAWLERGGVLATAHVRGGGAFGKEWHHAGRRATKPNTWKDFIACAEYLVKQKYTSPGKLAGKGGSAGGILIGRAITERPDLFAAAQISVGCTDMLRFESTMNGPPNVPEFGTVTKEDEFRGLLAMSTLHHIEDGVKYPAILLTHGINDPRVEPWESAKATARFQAATGSGKPVLFRVDYHAGHGIGSTKQQRQEELADVWAFFLQQMGEKGFNRK